MRRLLLLLVLSVATAILLAASGLAAAQVNNDPPTGTGPTGGDAPEDVGPTDRPPDDIVDADGGVVGDSPSGEVVEAEEGVPGIVETKSGQGRPGIYETKGGQGTEQGSPTSAKRGITKEGVEGVFVPVGGPDYLKQGEYIKQGVTMCTPSCIPGIDIIVEKKPDNAMVVEHGAEGLFVPESELTDSLATGMDVKDYNAVKSNTANLAAQDVESAEGILVPESNLVFGTDEQEIETQGVPGIFVPETVLGSGTNEEGLEVQGIIDPKSGLGILIKDDGTLLQACCPGFLKAIGQITAEQEGEGSVDQGDVEAPAAEPESGFFAGVWNFFKSIFS